MGDDREGPPSRGLRCDHRVSLVGRLALPDGILAGRPAAGEPLVSERVLADELGCNRHAIREAVRRLQQAGLVAVSHGGATRVLDWRATGGLDLLAQVGLTTNITTFKPTEVAFHEYKAIARDVRAARTWRARFGYVLRGPGWAPTD